MTSTPGLYHSMRRHGRILFCYQNADHMHHEAFHDMEGKLHTVWTWRFCFPPIKGQCSLQITMDEIDLHEPVGRGGYGAVYKATWRGAVVAVKCVACDVADVVALEQSIREVVLSKKMGHPNVVQTYAWTVLTGTAAVRAVREASKNNL